MEEGEARARERARRARERERRRAQRVGFRQRAEGGEVARARREREVERGAGRGGRWCCVVVALQLQGEVRERDGLRDVAVEIAHRRDHARVPGQEELGDRVPGQPQERRHGHDPRGAPGECFHERGRAGCHRVVAHDYWYKIHLNFVRADHEPRPAPPAVRICALSLARHGFGRPRARPRARARARRRPGREPELQSESGLRPELRRRRRRRAAAAAIRTRTRR